jgi:hypothetical protein
VKRSDRCEELGVDVRSVLKSILKVRMGGCELDLATSGVNDNEPWDFIKCGEFFD